MVEGGDAQARQEAPRGARRRWVRRVLGAQESGLLLVILILVAVLSSCSGTTPARVGILLGAGDRYEAAPVPGAGERHEVTITRADGSVERRRSATRPTTGAPGEDGLRRLFVTTSVNAFLNTQNLTLIGTYASFIAVMAVGMTGVIILGGIDLSVGSIYALAAISGAIVLHSMQGALVPGVDGPGRWTGWMPNAPMLVAVPLVLALCMGVGGACGLANGAMVVGLRVHPFVITLGMMAALRGLTTLVPKQVVGASSVGGFPPSVQGGFFKADVLGVQPTLIVIMVLVGLGGWLVLSGMVFGRRVYAIGGNETAARYAGVPVGRVKVGVYTLMGVLAGLSGAMYIGYFGGAATNAGEGYELKVIAAAVIGGASLSGGRGTALGAVLGAVLVQVIDAGMLTLRIPQEYNQIVMGLAIIIAVVIDQAKGALSRARRG